MQYTELAVTWNDETAKNPKPEYMMEFSRARMIGKLDSNIDGKIAKSELRGRIGALVLADFDKYDADKDGFLSETEATRLLPVLMKALTGEQRVLETGSPAAKP